MVENSSYHISIPIGLQKVQGRGLLGGGQVCAKPETGSKMIAYNYLYPNNAQ